MTAPQTRKPDENPGVIVKLAILAVGGQGGGVLTGWIEAVARSQGYAAQATSVAGVAQRTGATIYYIEMAPLGDHPPVFALAPSPGDVDVMIAAEMMEAGRSILRGFVTPGRTTLIASTHRQLAVSEKTVPGDGIASSEEVRAAAEIAADRLIMFDMDRLAAENGSVISSALLGALAASGALPFARAAFEDAIRASGKGVEASLRAFAAAYARTREGAAKATPAPAPKPDIAVAGPEALLRSWREMEAEAAKLAGETGVAGLRKTVRFQDLDYGRDYLDRLTPFARNGPDLAGTAAKHIANAMAYDDVIRVADAKTRKSRFARIRAEMGAGENPIRLTEFMHPRGEEIIGLFPAGLGRWVRARPALARGIDRLVNKGRRLRPHRVTGFAALWLMAGLRGWRRRTLRHAEEMESVAAWLARCRAALARSPEAAAALLSLRRLVKGYADTHLRGTSKFARAMETARLLEGRADEAAWIARLRDAALQDETDDALNGAAATIQSFT